MYNSRFNNRAGATAVAVRVATESCRSTSKGVQSKCVDFNNAHGEEPQDSCEPGNHDEAQGANDSDAAATDDVATQLGAALKDFEQVLPFTAFGRFFQRAKTQVMDVAQSPAVKFVGNVVTQLNDVTEHMDQRMDEFLTGMVLSPEGGENAAADRRSDLPVSHPRAPVLAGQSESTPDVKQAQQVEDASWGDFDFDDDSSELGQPVTQQRGTLPSQQPQRVICTSIDVSCVKDSAAGQRSPLHPHTPHTPMLGSPETVANVHRDVVKLPRKCFDAQLFQESKENALSQEELVERCSMLAQQTLAVQEECHALVAENNRLKHKHQLDGDAVLAEQLAIQVQHLMQEKARILQEKERLEKENGNLQQLLDYACASMARASTPGEGEEGSSQGFSSRQEFVCPSECHS